MNILGNIKERLQKPINAGNTENATANENGASDDQKLLDTINNTINTLNNFKMKLNVSDYIAKIEEYIRKLEVQHIVYAP